MDRPEFRVWEPLNKKMHYMDFALYEGKPKRFALPLEDQSTTGSYCAMNLDALILMQWTGLLDSAGKKIFEGDIVKAWVDVGPGGERELIHAVKISAFGPNLERWTFAGHGFEPEVIGNVYANPELLEAPHA